MPRGLLTARLLVTFRVIRSILLGVLLTPLVAVLFFMAVVPALSESPFTTRNLSHVFVGFMGWDGGVYAAFERGEYGVPLFGGWRTPLFAACWLGFVAASGLTTYLLCRWPRRLRAAPWRWAAAFGIGFPITCILMSVVVTLLDASGLWSGWFVEESALMHRGYYYLPHTHPLGLWIVFAVCWLAGAVTAPSIRPWLRRWVWVLPLMSILGAMLSVPLMIGLFETPSFEAGGTVARFALSVGIWCLGPAAILLVEPGPAFQRLAAWQRKRDGYGRECASCGYDLRGTVAAGRAACPECGEVIGESQQRYVTATTAGSLRDPGA